MSELEERLLNAKSRLAEALKAVAPKRKGGEMEEYSAAAQAVLEAERALAASKGEEYAVPIEMPVWDWPPSPYQFQSDLRTVLIYSLRNHEGYRDLSLEDVKRAGGPPEWFAVIEFEGCECSKMGTPNDEVLHGHPLYGKGLSFGGAMSIQNSKWITELERINSVHQLYKPAKWQKLHHYILPFQDCTFECVASGFKAQTVFKGIPQLLWELAGGPAE